MLHRRGAPAVVHGDHRAEAKSPGSSRSLVTHSLPYRTSWAPSPACQSFQDPDLLISSLAASADSRYFLHLEEDLNPGPTCCDLELVTRLL